MAGGAAIIIVAMKPSDRTSFRSRRLAPVAAACVLAASGAVADELLCEFPSAEDPRLEELRQSDPEDPRIDITSDQGELGRAGDASLSGNVRIRMGQRLLTADAAEIDAEKRSVSLKGIVEWQMNHRIPLVLLQPVAFGLYFIAMFAETNRPPFDLVEADTELTGGFHTEYSGFRYALFMIAEYVAMITVSVVATACFFGGWGGPFGFLPGIWWTFVGILFFFFMFVWVRATIPRLRYDQLMRFSWSYLIPIGLVNLAVTAVAVVVFDAR